MHRASLAVQWLRLHTSNAGAMGSIPGQGTKIPHVTEQLSLCAATTEPTCSGVHTPQLEKPTGHNEEPMQPKK